MRAVVCTGNAHKVDELRALLPALVLEPMAAGAELPPETADTFEGNARIKARGGAQLFPGAWVLADDSGLEVDALDGAPGVWSARFAGEGASDDANTALLLERLEGVDDDARTARFVCVLVAVAPTGEELVARGTVEGRIARSAAGDAGFGYDPVFVPDGETATFAQLGATVKARMSHRAAAASALAAMLPDG